MNELDEYQGERYPIHEVGNVLLSFGIALRKPGEPVVCTAPSSVAAHLLSNLGIQTLKVQQHPAYEDWCLVVGDGDTLSTWVP